MRATLRPWVLLSAVAACAHGPTAGAERGVDRHALAKFVGEQGHLFRACYERELMRDSSLRGRVVMRFTITPAGRAEAVELEEDSIGNAFMTACLQGVLEGLSFPFQPADPVPVQYPFSFAPKSG